jgi:hypothetical protein
MIDYLSIHDIYFKTLIFEIRHMRNLWAHQQLFCLRDVYRYLILKILESMILPNLY